MNILILSAGPFCLNLGRMNPSLGKRWRVVRHGDFGRGIFFGIGSIFWWKGMRGFRAFITRE